MNALPKPRIAIFPRENLPIICPTCSGSLGIIDARNLAQRHAWAVALSTLDLAVADDPGITTDANLLHGECPSCHAELAAISVAFRRPHEHGAEGADEPLPRLSLVLNGGAFAGWAMIETRDADGTECIEHLFEPRPSMRAEKSIEYLREHLLADLPRPGGGSGQP